MGRSNDPPCLGADLRVYGARTDEQSLKPESHCLAVVSIGQGLSVRKASVFLSLRSIQTSRACRNDRISEARFAAIGEAMPSLQIQIQPSQPPALIFPFSRRSETRRAHRSGQSDPPTPFWIPPQDPQSPAANDNIEQTPPSSSGRSTAMDGGSLVSLHIDLLGEVKEQSLELLFAELPHLLLIPGGWNVRFETPIVSFRPAPELRVITLVSQDAAVLQVLLMDSRSSVDYYSLVLPPVERFVDLVSERLGPERLNWILVPRDLSPQSFPCRRQVSLQKPTE